MEKKKLLLLGGNRYMKEILDQARSMGYHVGITDWYDRQRSPIKSLADEAFDESITDMSAMEKLIQDHGYQGVLTGYTDSYLPTLAEICETNNLPCYGTKEQFEILINKGHYKKLLKDFGVPTLPTFSWSEVKEDFDHFPLLLKPNDGSGSRGLKIIEDYKSYSEAKKEIETNNRLDHYTIEPFIRERDELTAFFLFIEGESYVSATGNRFLSEPLGEKIALPICYSIPSSFDEVFRRYTAEPMKEMLQSLGVNNGMLFAQCMMYKGKAHVYDIGYRLTGSLEYKLQKALYGFDPLEMMIRYAMTGKMLEEDKLDIDKMMDVEGYGFNLTILGKVGVIKHVRGHDVIKNDPRILDIAFNQWIDNEITEDKVGTLEQIVARVFFLADSIEDAREIMDFVYSTLEVKDEKGKSLLFTQMCPNKLLKYYNKL